MIRHPDPPRVLAISPPRPGPWVEEVGRLARAGVDGLVIRLVAAPSHLPEVLSRVAAPGLVVRVRPVDPGDVAIAHRHGLPLHLPAGAPPPPRDTAWGRSCHDATAVARAAAEGAGYALVSPVFPPGSKPDDTRPPLGVSGLRALLPAPIPVLALGGIDPPRAAACVEAGAHGVAGIGAFFADGHVRFASAQAVVAAVHGALAPTTAG